MASWCTGDPGELSELGGLWAEPRELWKPVGWLGADGQTQRPPQLEGARGRAAYLLAGTPCSRASPGQTLEITA